MSKKLAEVEKELIQRVLDENNGNRVAAAKVLGISKFSLARRCKKYGIPNGKPGRPIVPDLAAAG
ncbi:MAG TPA: helix-turn-helix domain-containing protein [Oligoflexus sp.]|uniref:helix-turn-helix domain-containing protein n=1 Tax=Oligoflexus sp. TaxID=1971216 RepID=UPI002D40F7EE|nr:helix-turn-helix domain-containing protein [Oligoflexus sp.]HYX39952.1 helix-turn-helix domain-containing protein [Oligoflexus sp.]